MTDEGEACAKCRGSETPLQSRELTHRQFEHLAVRAFLPDRASCHQNIAQHSWRNTSMHSKALRSSEMLKSQLPLVVQAAVA